MSIRAFIAIAVPESVLRRCQKISADLRKLNLEGRFAQIRSLHLTLQFLGNIEEAKLAGIGEALEDTGKEVASFHVEICQLGVFPHLARPRVVWVGVEPVEALKELQSKIQQRLERLGFPKENREFHPHLTLLRLKSRKNLAELTQYVQGEGAHQKAGSIRVKEIHLYQSILKPEGAEYRKLLTARLKGPA
ncbi:MAG: RNA 2',3'-cyclic phosphodiesterase [Acidobacteria bacterium]|nr:RNA 2',3'-cyclic phosphodiesterase [Acidobacteriota bacterium]